MAADDPDILIPREKILQRVAELADEIAAVYGEKEANGLTLVTILAGSIIFLADLIRRLPLQMKIGLVTVSSYPGPATESRGAEILSELNLDVAGRDVLLVDDILDTGGTIRVVRRRLAASGARSVRTCVLLRKPSKAPADVVADFVGFDIDDVFVVGYGLDYNNLYRNLPDIRILSDDQVDV